MYRIFPSEELKIVAPLAPQTKTIRKHWVKESNTPVPCEGAKCKPCAEGIYGTVFKYIVVWDVLNKMPAILTLKNTEFSRFRKLTIKRRPIGIQRQELFDRVARSDIIISEIYGLKVDIPQNIKDKYKDTSAVLREVWS